MDNEKKITREELVKFLAKSMYKSVKKALSAQGKKYSEKAYANEGKEVVEDILDENYIAEAKEKVPPRKSHQMNKAIVDEGLSDKEKKEARAKRETTSWKYKFKPNDPKYRNVSEKGVHMPFNAEKKPRPQRTSQGGLLDDKQVNEGKKIRSKQNIKWLKENKPNIPKSEKGIDKLKKFKAKINKNRCWEGYEPVKGKKPYSEGSCRKEDK